MFFRLFALVLLVLLGALLAGWLGAQPGMLALEWLGWQIELRTSLAVAILALAALALILLDRLLRGLLDLPSWLGRNLARRRTESGHRALTLGLMAVSAGEPEEARRQAVRAQRLLAAPRLTDLLSAQAAHLSGDHAAAGRYFTSLTRDPDTAFLGHIGLARLALEDEQPDKALVSARRALDLRPKSALAGRQVMLLEAERGNWAAALPAQAVAATGADDSESRRLAARQRAALTYLDVISGLDMEADPKRLREQARRLETALAAWPEFWPAALMFADIQQAAGQPRKSTKVLESAFRAMPHKEVASRLGAVWATSEGSYIAKLIKLIPNKQSGLADEGRRIVASAALDHGLVGEARRLLEEIDPPDRDAEAWRLLSRLAAAAEDATSETAALRRAGEAPRPRRWQCTSCRLVHDEWNSHCGGCAGFLTLDWQRPDGVTPLQANTSPQLTKVD